MKLRTEEETLLLELLKKLKPGFLPYDIFLEFARIVALPIIELVPLRSNHLGGVEILLLERDREGDLWSGKLHVPGTVVRAGDVQETDKAFSRIVKEELRNTVLGDFNFVCNTTHASKRGTEVAQVYWAEVQGDPKAGSFYDAEHLPENLMDSQRVFIASAINNYRNR